MITRGALIHSMAAATGDYGERRQTMVATQDNQVGLSGRNANGAMAPSLEMDLMY